MANKNRLGEPTACMPWQAQAYAPTDNVGQAIAR